MMRNRRLAIAITVAAAVHAQNRMAFEVASVKPARGAVMPSNVLLTPWDDGAATGGRFVADSTLSGYIQFAWKL